MLIQSIIVTLLSLFSFTTEQNHSLTVEVTNIKEIKGHIAISIYDKAENFPKNEKKYIFRSAKVKVTKNSVKYTFMDLPQGTYAIALSHDANSNGKFDSNFIGMPLEGYGFSTNFVPKLSAPDFEEVDFELDKAKTIGIKMIY
jgi:uncharacterized protein (DUF2141 family)